MTFSTAGRAARRLLSRPPRRAARAVPPAGPGPVPTRPYVIFNPVRKDAEARRQLVRGSLADAGLGHARWLDTTEQDPGAGWCRQAVAEGADLVLACGGDGTVMECVTGIAGSGVPLALLPAGTGNLLALNFGIPLPAAEAIEVALHGARRKVDVGTVGEQRFAVMAGMGFDAAMLRDAPARLKHLIGWPAYVLSGLVNLRRSPLADFALHLDDAPPLHRTGRGVLVANVGRLQGGIAMLAGAQCDDGLLEVAILKPRTVLNWAGLAGRVVTRRARTSAQLETWAAARVLVESDRPLALELDGEVRPEARRLEAGVLPGALTLCVPAA